MFTIPFPYSTLSGFVCIPPSDSVFLSPPRTMTLCCSSGSWTCILLALPIPSCGMSPSPPISLEVSTMTTRFRRASLSWRETSRIAVVLPTPGLGRGGQKSGKEPKVQISELKRKSVDWNIHAHIPGTSFSPAQEQHRGPRLHEVPNQLRAAPDGSADTAGQPNNGAPPGC